MQSLIFVFIFSLIVSLNLWFWLAFSCDKFQVRTNCQLKWIKSTKHHFIKTLQEQSVASDDLKDGTLTSLGLDSSRLCTSKSFLHKTPAFYPENKPQARNAARQKSPAVGCNLFRNNSFWIPYSSKWKEKEKEKKKEVQHISAGTSLSLRINMLQTKYIQSLTGLSYVYITTAFISYKKSNGFGLNTLINNKQKQTSWAVCLCLGGVGGVR